MAQPPSSSELRRTLKASLSALANDIKNDKFLQPTVKQRHMDDLKQIAASIGTQIDVDGTNRMNVLNSTSLLLNRISSSFSRTSLATAQSDLRALQNSYIRASDQRRRAVAQAELEAGRVQDAELRHLETVRTCPSEDRLGSGGSSNTSSVQSVQFNSGNRGSYDSLAPQPPPSLYSRHPNPSTKSVNKDSAHFTRVHDDGAYPSAQQPRPRSLRSVFQGSNTSLVPPSASYPYSQQPQYGGQGHHPSAASLVPPVPQMPSLAPGSMYPGTTTSPQRPQYGGQAHHASAASLVPPVPQMPSLAPGSMYPGATMSPPGPNYYPANPSRTSLMPAPGQPYASTHSLQGQYYALL
ncbi:hypothetical protein BDZ89DRAFT_1112974 [Hymenopellis radicata]|nr:hypothetical protein BDZ89DRAFT_1112974 [Hymenopellis radicata]